MESIVFFGKGGIGKSTLASNITAILAAGGKKVLHVGCDPKMDSTLALMGAHIRSFTSKTAGPGQEVLQDSVHASPIKDIHCIEAGGPQPGVGCAGTGIGSMLDAIKDSALLETGGYGAAVFDVLGDVVCGGFAAPLRRGFAKKVVIVTSEEMLSLHAANRLIMMTENYARNGVYLAGLAANVKTPGGAALVREFARAVNARVLGVTLRDPAVAAAERAHIPAALAYPDSDFARRAWKLCTAIRASGPPAAPPRALTDAEFFAFAEGRRPAAARKPTAGKPAKPGAPRSAASLFAAVDMRPAGMEGDQMICDWDHGSGACRIVIGPASGARPGMAVFSDWTVCFHPTAGKAAMAAAAPALTAAARRLAALRFDELLSVFTGLKDFYGGLLGGVAPEDRSLTAPGTPLRPHTGFGQWQRFIFPGGAVEAHIPAGSVLVEHGDSECRFCGCEGGALGAFSESAGPKGGGRDQRGPQLPRPDARIVNTDFNTADSVFGDEAKTLKALYAAADQAGPGGLIEFYVGCAPLMLASDTVSLVRRVEREKGVKIVIERFNSFYEHSPVKSGVRAAFMAHKLTGAAAGPARDVCLVNWGAAAPAMAALLAERGISSVIPGEDFYADARSARLQALPGPDAVLAAAFDKAGMKWILPGAPYGFAGTEAWLKAVARALGRKKIAAGPTAAQKKSAAGLQMRVKNFAAAFVLAPEEIALLSGSAALKMVPVLPVLAEAGFKIRLLLPATEPPAAGGRAGKSPSLPGKAAAALATLKAANPGLRVSAAVFRTPAELRALLRADKALRLVYSDIRLDPRVTAAGKTPFSASLFEAGYEGALETRRRLLELCQWDFNERYLRQ
ncbi:MAG TPA: nitrogenase component 1 [Elusimicrobiales bacterium]|nr:nitrogenase component 1 [Elusimicrobiales bacterium]